MCSEFVLDLAEVICCCYEHCRCLAWVTRLITLLHDCSDGTAARQLRLFQRWVHHHTNVDFRENVVKMYTNNFASDGKEPLIYLKPRF